MYLKRLEIKGFKSFADKCIIKLETGISSIVGPNGSGKSNICDAILWVLGERNAKELRGGVMEDVIFAGSAKRNPVSVAEVTLVLDNSDDTLPFEYNEVSLSRRLYRSGESDYLINGISVRRLDVLDILHDSGIGTDTNSIISQGHLDSILQSRPIDRRTLIEETAGVLKHKQRKNRSIRKLERMDSNLERINDIMAEIERQLKPLRIKAKRAAAYDGLVEELSGLNLEIAVDDLKIIKSKWDKTNDEKNKLQQLIDSKKHIYQDKEKQLSNIRNKINSQSGEIVEYSTKQRKLSSCIDKLNSYSMLLAEKSKNAKAKFESLVNEESKSRSNERFLLQAEIEKISISKSEINKEYEALLDEFKNANCKYNKSIKDLSCAQSDYDKTNGQLKAHQKQSLDLRKKINDASDDIVKAQAKTAALNTQIKDIKDKIKEQTANCEYAQSQKNNLFEKLERTNTIYEDNQKTIDETTTTQNKFKEDTDKLSDQLTDINTNIIALEKIIETSYENSSDATKWFVSHKQSYPSVSSLSDSVDIPDKYINLVDALLGDYTSSFASSEDDIIKAWSDLNKSDNADGSVHFIKKVAQNHDSASYGSLKDFANKEGGKILADQLSFKNNELISALENIVVFEDSSLALNASKKTKSICCCSLDGTIVYPDGRYLVGSPFYMDKIYDDSNSVNVLSYEKNLKRLKKQKTQVDNSLIQAKAKYEEANLQLSSLREQELKLKNDMAGLNAEYEVANKNLEKQTGELELLKSRLDKAIESSKLLKDAYAASAPDLENFKRNLIDLNEQIKKDESNISNYQKVLDDARIANDNNKQVLNDVNIKIATLKERLNATDYNLESAKNRLHNYDVRFSNNAKEKRISELVSKHTYTISKLLQSLSVHAEKDLLIVDANFKNINADAAKIQKESEELTRSSNYARNEFDQLNNQMSELKVEIGRLEVQVQNAVNTIDSIDGISVDKALEMPEIENREEKENRAFKIRRRIANMGTINPEAKKDYEILKERYDFLNDQVDDLLAAKHSLSKINKIIDERMKDDFIDTFNEVNINFQEIFSILFPGGKSKLVLEDPDDVENSGVEVVAQPHGKRLSKMSLMSGGEKSLVALCLLFAVYKKRSTPFYILDEVEAALDDTNLRRLIKYLNNLRYHTQLIMITHQRRTMEMADILYGVSMKNDGVTRVVSQKLDKVKTDAATSN